MEPESPTSETPAQRQARIRREKRERKVLEGGASRLDKITSLSGRPTEEATPIASSGDRSASHQDSFKTDSSPSRSARVSSNVHGSPHTSLAVDQGELEASMRRLLRSTGTNSDEPSFNLSDSSNDHQEQPADDPMMRLLQQMMGMPSSAEPSSNPNSKSDGLPPNLTAMLNGEPPNTAQIERGPSTRFCIWKILHVSFALSIGAYIVLPQAFTGSFASRFRLESGASPSEGMMFWAFVTAELGLQTARYLLEGNKEEPGMVGTLSSVLPSPWKERFLLASRYASYWSTLVEDAMIIIWMLGAAAWWQGDHQGIAA